MNYAEDNAVAAVECQHMPTAIAFADTALKAADVKLIGYELSKKAGGVVIKLTGSVSALKAAVEAGKAVADQINGIYGISFLARPARGIEEMIYSRDTVGLEMETTQKKSEGDSGKKAEKPKADEVSAKQVTVKQAQTVADKKRTATKQKKTTEPEKNIAGKQEKIAEPEKNTAGKTEPTAEPEKNIAVKMEKETAELTKQKDVTPNAGGKSQSEKPEGDKA